MTKSVLKPLAYSLLAGAAIFIFLISDLGEWLKEHEALIAIGAAIWWMLTIAGKVDQQKFTIDVLTNRIDRLEDQNKQTDFVLDKHDDRLHALERASQDSYPS